MSARSRPRARPLAGPWIWAGVSGFLLGIVVPLLLIATVPDVGRSDAWIVTAGLIVYSGWRLAIMIGRGRPTLLDFFFMVFVYLFLGLAPTVQMRSGLLSTTTPGMDPSLDLPIAGCVVLGIGCYEAGRLLAGRARGDRVAERLAEPHLEPVVSAPRAAILLGIGVLAAAYFVGRVGLGPLFSNRDAFSNARQAAWPDSSTAAIVYALAIYPLLVGVGGMIQIWRSAPSGRRARYLIAALGGAVVLLVIVNPLSSARYPLGTVLFALVVLVGALGGRLRVQAALAATVAGLIFLFPLADAFRTSVVRVGRSSFFGEYQGNPDYDGFWQIGNALRFWESGGAVPGRQALGLLLFWVPRSVYADKPVDTGIALADFRGYSFTNLSAPLWAELLVNGGVVALGLGFLVIGAIGRLVDRHLEDSFHVAGWWTVAGAIVPVYTVILLRGSLLQATGALVVTVVCLVLVRRSAGDAIRSRLRSRRRPGPARRPPSRTAPARAIARARP